MFGHQDKDNQSSNDDDNAISDESIHGALNDTSQSQATTVADPDTPGTGADNPAWQHPGQPIAASPAKAKDVISPVGGFPRSTNDQVQAADFISPTLSAISTPDDTTTTTVNQVAPTPAATANHELIDIKQHALEELGPLIDKLDQKPDEKFRTIMMMIQASDDQQLVAKAFESAHAIEDEKVRAQALLDIVNEINYFTQQTSQTSSEK